MIYNTLLFIILFIWPLTAYSESPDESDYQTLRNSLIEKYKNEEPGQLLFPNDIILNTNEKAVAFTFDACGGINGGRYNKELIDFLIKGKIPATLFVTGRWIDENPKIFIELAANPLFEIESHGLNHKVASIDGKTVYKIAGNQNIGELIDEVELNARKIAAITGKKPLYYRAATGWYEETAIKIINALGYKIVNGNSEGFDFSNKISAEKICKNIFKTKKPSIIMLHMNHPSWKEKDALVRLVPMFKNKGYKFVKLEEFGIVEKEK